MLYANNYIPLNSGGRRSSDFPTIIQIVELKYFQITELDQPIYNNSISAMPPGFLHHLSLQNGINRTATLQ